MDTINKKKNRILFSTFIITLFVSLLLIPTMLFFPNDANARSSRISNQFITISTVKYRRAGAESATLAALGRKRSRVGHPAFFENIHHWQSGTIQIRQATRVSLTSTEVHALSGRGFLRLSNGGRVNVGGLINHRTTGNFVLIKLELANKINVISKLNSDRHAKSTLKNEKKKGRIITAVWVLIEGSETQLASFNLSGTYAAAEGNGTATINSQGRSVIQFSPNTIMAYEMSKVKWKWKGLRRKSIKKLKIDNVWR